MNTWERLAAETEQQDLMQAKLVMDKGYPNMYGAKILVKSAWNISKLKKNYKTTMNKESFRA